MHGESGTACGNLVFKLFLPSGQLKQVCAPRTKRFNNPPASRTPQLPGHRHILYPSKSRHVLFSSYQQRLIVSESRWPQPFSTQSLQIKRAFSACSVMQNSLLLDEMKIVIPAAQLSGLLRQCWTIIMKPSDGYSSRSDKRGCHQRAATTAATSRSLLDFRPVEHGALHADVETAHTNHSFLRSNWSRLAKRCACVRRHLIGRVPLFFFQTKQLARENDASGTSPLRAGDFSPCLPAGNGSLSSNSTSARPLARGVAASICAESKASRRLRANEGE